MKWAPMSLPIALLAIFTGGSMAQDKQLQSDAALPELVAALKSSDFNTRMRAVDFIGYRKEAAREAVPALVDALRDYHMRESALHALKAIGPAASEAIPALYDALTAYPKQPATSWIAADAMASVGEAAIPTLVQGIASNDLRRQLWCTAALAKMEGPESVHFRTLAALLSSPDKKTALVAARALTMIGAPSKIVLTQIIASMDNPVAPRTDLAILLAQFGKDASPAIPRLVHYLDDPDPMTRQRTAYALSEIGGAAVAPAKAGLIRMLSEEQAYVRENAAVALGSIGDSADDSIPHLIKRLGDENEHVRAASVAALGKIKVEDPVVLEALKKAMADPSGRVRSTAAPLFAEHAPINEETIQWFVEASEDNWKGVLDACEEFFGRLGPDQHKLIPEKFRSPNRR